MGDVLEDAMPGGCHPALAEVADLIRPYLDGSRYAVQFIQPRSLQADWRFDDAPPLSSNTDLVSILTVRRCGGPAPWAYTPFAYTWFAGTDDLGRSIGGETVIRVVDHSRLLVDGFPTYETVLDTLEVRRA